MLFRSRISVSGTCDPKFAAVEAAFRRNMEEGDPACGDEVGACVAVVVEGKPVVDLWSGWRDGARTRSWEADTITCMMSVAKACASGALLKLVAARSEERRGGEEG